MSERLEEWNGLKKGDPVTVQDGAKGAAYTFAAYVTSASGAEFVDVIEQQSANRKSKGSRLQRSFKPDRVSPA